VKFSGDVAHLENARVEATLALRLAPAWQLSNPRPYPGRRIFRSSPERYAMRMARRLGEVFGNAVWRRSTGDLEFQARSTLNIRGLLGSFGLAGAISDLIFLAPPRLDLSAKARVGEGQPEWRVIGRANFERFTYRGIPFLGANAEFSWDGTRTMIRDVHIRHQTGELIAQAARCSGRFPA